MDRLASLVIWHREMEEQLESSPASIWTLEQFELVEVWFDYELDQLSD